MSKESITRWVAVIVFGGAIVVDILLDKYDCPTFSQGVIWLMYKHQLGWVVPVVIGILVGHFCWPQKFPK